MRSYKYLLFILFIFISLNSIKASIVLEKIDKQSIPSIKYFNTNKEYIRAFSYKKITVYEYITDPLIMYTSLWGCFGITLPLWETNSGIKEDNVNYWQPYSNRGFGQIAEKPDVTFLDRMKMEPFASGRIDPVTKVWNNTVTFRNDIYAKNIVEPIYFTYLTLYMRAKNYHPAIMITEIVLLSFLYEFTIRPFYLNASFEQFLKNPGVSIIVGILFDELSTFLLTTPYAGLHVLAYFFNPFNALPNARIHPMLFFDPYRKAANIEAIIKL